MEASIISFTPSPVNADVSKYPNALIFFDNYQVKDEIQCIVLTAKP